MLPWCISRRRELACDSRLGVCFWLFLPPSLFFLFKGLMGRVEGNWPFICYMTILPLALAWQDGLREGWWKRWGMPAAFAVPGCLTAFILIHSLVSLPVPPAADRLAKSQSRFEIIHKVADWARAEGIGKMYASNYQLTSQLRFQQIEADQLPGISRTSHFIMRNEIIPNDEVMYLLVYLDKGRKYPGWPMERYGNPRVAASFPEIIGGTQTGEYMVVRYERVE